MICPLIGYNCSAPQHSFRRDPALVLAFAVDATAAHPSVTVDAVNNLSILAYLSGLCHLDSEVPLPVALASCDRRAIDLKINLEDRIRHIEGYIYMEFVRQSHNGTLSLPPYLTMILTLAIRATFRCWSGN